MDVDGPALLEENDGCHPRLTHWWWAAGAGRLADGRTAMWNAVVGLNDTLPHIENTLWIDSSPQPIGLVSIAKDLRTVTFDDGNVLRFQEEAERATTIDFSSYARPTGRRLARSLAPCQAGWNGRRGTESWKTTALCGRRAFRMVLFADTRNRDE